MKTLSLPIVAVSLFLLFAACSKEETETTPPPVDDTPEEEVGEPMASVSNLAAESTLNANELLVKWTNPADAAWAQLSWWLDGQDASGAEKMSVEVTSGQRSSVTITVEEYGNYNVGVVAMDNYGNRSEQVVV